MVTSKWQRRLIWLTRRPFLEPLFCSQEKTKLYHHTVFSLELDCFFYRFIPRIVKRIFLISRKLGYSCASNFCWYAEHLHRSPESWTSQYKTNIKILYLRSYNIFGCGVDGKSVLYMRQIIILKQIHLTSPTQWF